MSGLGGATRIAVVGSPGAGKSTTARAIAAATGLPLVHLDRLYWRAGWVPSAEPEWRGTAAALAAGDRWVIDGNYGGSLDLRLRRADLVVWLDLSTVRCLWGVLRRRAAFRGRTRPDMADDCPERLDAEFLRFVLRFRRDDRPALAAALAGFPGRCIRVTDARRRAALMRRIAGG